MQGIVIQGPTDYCEQIIPCYKDIPNVVWSTWEDEPEENIRYIEQHIDIILNKKPLFPGYLNVNLQTHSTFKGIEYLYQNKGIIEVLKTRGDVRIKNLAKLLECLKSKKMAFIAICKKDIRKDIYYELVYPHYSHDYPADQIVYGNIENMLNSFRFNIEEFLPIPPEALIAYHFLEGIGKEFILTYDYFKKNDVYFYLNDCVNNNIELFLLKEKYRFDLVDIHNSKQYYEF